MATENTLSQQLLDLLATRNLHPEMLDRSGRPTNAPDAKTFTFDYEGASGKNYGTMVIVLDSDNEMKIMYGDNLGRTMEGTDKNEFFEFIQHLSKKATMNRWTHTIADISQLKHTMQGLAAIQEGLFEGYYGNRKISYAGLPTQARLKIKHSQPLGENDARFRHVESLFIETAEGECFRLGFRNLSGGRAMLEHVRQGGKPYDIRGCHLTEMVNEIATLARFNRASAGRVLEGVTQEVVSQAQVYYKQLRENLKRMSTSRGYSNYFESWHPADITQQEELVENIKTLFVEQTIDTRIEQALPLLAKIQQGRDMKEAEIFESWINNLAEGTWNLPETPEQLDKLKTLMASELIVGPDAINATEQLYDLVGDDILFDRLSELAAKDPRANAWNDTEVMNRLAELGVQMPEPSTPGNPAEPQTAAPAPVAEGAAAEGLSSFNASVFKPSHGQDRAAWVAKTEKQFPTAQIALTKTPNGPAKATVDGKVVAEFPETQGVAEGYYDLNDEGMQPIDLSANPSFKEIVNRYTQLVYQGHASETSPEEDQEYDAIEQYVAKRFGEKGSAHLQKAGEVSYWGRDDKPYGRDSRSSNLGRPNQPGGDFRTTKAGKMHGQDVKMMKAKVADRLGRHPEPNLPESAELDTMLKHAGITVAEGRILDESGETFDHILSRFKHEVKRFEEGDELDSDLYEALFDYYSDHGEIPYGIAKGRTGDPYEWVSQRLAQDLGINEGWKGALAGGLAGGALGSVVPALGTLAGAAAGAYAGHKLGDEGFKDPDAEYKKAQKLKQPPPVAEADPISTFEVMSGFDAPVAEGSCNMTAEGQYCPEHGLMECGGVYESALSRLKSLAKIEEGWKGELAGGTVGGVGGTVAGSALGALAGGPVGAAIGGVVGGAAGGTAGQMAGRELTKEEQLDEIAPLVAAGARAVLPLLAKVGPALGRMASGAGKSGAAVAGKAATGIGRGTVDVAKSAAQSAAQNADKIGIGLGAYQAITDVANNTMGGVGEVYRDVGQAADAITQTVGNAIDGKTIAELAGTAVKYSIPIGILLAVLYGGKKLIDQVMAEGADDTVMGSLGKFAGSITPNTGDFTAGFKKTFEGDAMLARIKSLAMLK